MSAALPRPRLQVALDTRDLPSALGPLQRAAGSVDVIEVGTVLCLAEGMHAVRAVRALFPDRPVLADLRIAEAGAILSRLAFEAGADWVSVVAGASAVTVEQVCAVAREHGGQVQVELGEHVDLAQAAGWRAAGVEHVIVHRSRDAEAAGEPAWTADDVRHVHDLHALGFVVTITGGISRDELTAFAGAPVGIVIAGRAIVEADDPAAAAADLRDALAEVWP